MCLCSNCTHFQPSNTFQICKHMEIFDCRIELNLFVTIYYIHLSVMLSIQYAQDISTERKKQNVQSENVSNLHKFIIVTKSIYAPEAIEKQQKKHFGCKLLVFSKLTRSTNNWFIEFFRNLTKYLQIKCSTQRTRAKNRATTTSRT